MIKIIRSIKDLLFQTEYMKQIKEKKKSKNSIKLENNDAVDWKDLKSGNKIDIEL